ncbi:molybdopterin-dependent oxidoreductase [Tepidimicrobium xylanilyticum]|uniref:molybdopterin-dependent oxidoreductase n=1 Tax=Tepidimicrobium xylanilyticum TaxID=1123352 RepID=UPI002653BD89|nr:molybdopterin-dependent oxidoreductase [Tepidimicrobium xylanilyticum]GMG96000.1 hypothetical protein EN5CB1_08260 [Tepidimicrobium xylanilyticum]
MRRFKLIKLVIIIILNISLSLTGCKSKDRSENIAIDLEQEKMVDLAEEEEMGTDTGGEVTPTEEEAVQEEIEEVEEEEVVKEETTDQAQKPKETEPQKADEEEVVEEEAALLKIEGKVGKELKLTLKDLKAMDDIIFQADYYSINNFGTTAHTNFKGVNLWKLLEKANISSEAAKVSIIATDGYSMEFTVEEVKRQDYIDETDPNKKLPMIIAWEENGVEYDPVEGPPFKLIVGQKEAGDVNKPQWVSNIDRIVVE